MAPVLFEHWFNATAFSKGVTLAAVNGRNYGAYVKLALSLGIPVAIVSDNDTADGNSTKTIVDNQIDKIKSETDWDLSEDWFFLDYLSDPNDFEAEIVNACGLRDEVIAAFVERAKEINQHPAYIAAKQKELEELSDDDLIKKMRSEKTSYSGFLADQLSQNGFGKPREVVVPQAFQSAFVKVEAWLK